ncbi:SAM-dependent methyltransferase [Nocardia terpenica]|uniref:SAM-dependent methyltransferase n=1 Tax=Nocardia terpenica TaxID=455432 RepID=UPI0038CD3D8E
MVRTEGDTWDIVSSVGVTALGVAAERAIESARSDALMRDPYAELFVAASGHEEMNRLLADPAARPDAVQGSHFMGLRSRYFDDYFLTATAGGARQAVILASGLDTRAYRLAWPAGTVVFELDQPDVLEFKEKVLADHGACPAADRRGMAADLRDDWTAALLDAGFDPTVPTAWAAEGLLAYLPGATQDLLFERIDQLSAPGSGLATDYAWLAGYSDDELAGIYFEGVEVRGLLYGDARVDPDAWFAARGWHIDAVVLPELATRYGRRIPADLDRFNSTRNHVRYLTARSPLRG